MAPKVSLGNTYRAYHFKTKLRVGDSEVLLPISLENVRAQPLHMGSAVKWFSQKSAAFDLGFLRSSFLFGSDCRVFLHELWPLNDDDDWRKYPVTVSTKPTRALLFRKAPERGEVPCGVWGVLGLVGSPSLVLCRVHLLPRSPRIHTRQEERTAGWGRGMSLVLPVRRQVAPILWQVSYVIAPFPGPCGVFW